MRQSGLDYAPAYMTRLALNLMMLGGLAVQPHCTPYSHAPDQQVVPAAVSTALGEPAETRENDFIDLAITIDHVPRI